MPRYKDLTGKRVGQQTVLSRYGVDKHGHILWKIKCDCGDIRIISGTYANRIKSDNARCKKCLNVTLRKKVGIMHHNWKGDRVKYCALHQWLYRKLGKPKRCSVCGTSDKTKVYHWANISGEYKRNITDWKRTCVKCHKKIDGALIGEMHNMSKLVESEVLTIRRMADSGVTRKELARLYGVTKVNIGHIVKRATWKHI